MGDWISLHVGSGSINDRYYLMLGSFTQTPNRLRTSNRNRSIVCMRTRKKRLYLRRVLHTEHGTFTPLVFPTTSGMGRECLRYLSRLAELIAIKKGQHYAKNMTWIRSEISFAILVHWTKLFWVDVLLYRNKQA